MKLYSFKKKFKNRFEKIERVVNAKNDRERMLIFGVSIFLILFIWQSMVMDLQIKSLSKERTQTEIMDNEYIDSKKALIEIDEKLKKDPLSSKKMYKASLIKQLESLNKEFKVLTSNLVNPEQMQVLLKEILKESPGLKLISLQSLQSSPLMEKDLSISLYRHSMNIVMEGEYFPLVAFLERVEKNKLRVLWTQLTINTKDYPNQKIELTISTLSDDVGWIGV